MTAGVVQLSQRLIFEALGQFAALAALVGARIYPDVAPQSVARPFVVWFEYFTGSANDLSGFATSSSLDNVKVHVTSWATSATQARQIDMAVRGAMAAATGMKAVYTDTRAMDYEADTKLFGVQSDFSLWIKT